MAAQVIFPDGIDHAHDVQAMAQCVMAGNYLINRSDLDVICEIDGFRIRIPAGQRILCTGWDQVRRCVADMDHEEFYGCAAPVNRCGFKFVTGHQLYIYNDLVVWSPDSAVGSGYYGPRERTLEEHIALINTMKLTKATIIAEDLSFLPRCPSLRCLSILHGVGRNTPLDFSPLYDLPEIERLSIAAPNMGLSKGPAIHIDFTRLRGLRRLSVCTNDPFNYSQVPTLESLSVANDRLHADLSGLSRSPGLKRLDLLSCGMKSLKGIEQYPLQALDLSYLRGLSDISALSGCAGTLRSLSIDACGKIKDFSCLSTLENLEFLQLHGSNILPDLGFIRSMPRLKVLNFTMTIEDGDLTPCLRLPYVTFSRGKRHYNLKDRDLPKNLDGQGFELK